MKKLPLLLILTFCYSSFCFTQTSSDTLLEADVQELIALTRIKPRKLKEVRKMVYDIESRYELDCVQKARVFLKLGAIIYLAKEEEHYEEGISILQDSTFNVWRNCDSIAIKELFNPSYMLLKLYEYKDRGFQSKKLLEYIDANPEMHKGKPITLMSSLYGMMGSLRGESGDPLAAQQYFNKAAILFDSLSNPTYKLEFLSRYGAYLNDNKRYDESIETYEKGFGDLRDDIDSLPLLINYMSPLLSLGELDKIENFIEDLNPLIEKSTFDNHKSYAYYQMTKYYIASGNMSAAKNSLQQLEQLYNNDKDKRTLASDYFSVAGKFHSANNNFTEATSFYDAAVLNQIIGDQPDIYSPGQDLSESIINDYETLVINLKDLFQVRLKKFDASGNLEDLDNALSLVEELDGIFETNRSEFLSEFSKITQVESSYTVFEDAIDACYKQYSKSGNITYLNKAFKWSAKNKSSVLNSMVSSNALYKKTITEQEFESLTQLETNKRKVESELNTPGENRKVLSQKYLDLRSEQRKTLNALNKKYPGLQNNIANQFSNSSDQILKDKLDAKTALIDIFYGRDRIFLFFISNQKSHFLSKLISPEDKQLFNSIETDLYGYSNLGTLNKNSKTLFDLYFKESLSFFKNNGITDLIIVPDGQFHNVPLEILWDGENYLVEQYNISYLYSYTQLNKSVKSIATDYLGFGTEYSNSLNNNLKTFFKQSDQAYSALGDTDMRLSKLPSSSKEISNANEAFNGSIFLDSQSTKKNFLDQAPKSKGIIHMALHGLVLNENTSCILFDDEDKNMVLNSNEVYGLNLNNELSILSACYSATGKIYKGEGVRNLARSFLYAGTKSIVPSLWASSDISNTKLINGFLVNMKEGGRPSIALTESKINYLETASPANKHTAYWGNMIYVGNPNSYNSSIEGIKLFAILGFSFLLLLLFFRNRSRQ